MSLFLVQHGKNLSKETDPEQGLSEEGIGEVKLIASTAGNYRVHVSRIMHSEKKRAKQTAEIFASTLDPENGVHERKGLKPLDDVITIADEINCKDNLMLVGHLPFMERLTSYLINKSTEYTIFKFQNGGILCMDQNEEPQAWFIKWALIPKTD